MVVPRPRTPQFTAVAILLVAFALRVTAIDQTPPGLSHDEAYNGIAALDVLSGQRPLFFEINKGIEPLIIYLEALAFTFYGVGPTQMRLINGIFGLLTVALVYPLAARLLNQRIALLAMAGVTVSFWAVFVSRLTLRAVLLPPLLILTLYFFWVGLTTPKQNRVALGYFALAGAWAGVTMYTYLSSRFVPLIIITIFGYQLLCRRIKRRHWLGLLLFFIIWAALFTPLAHYFWQNTASFTRRANQVSTISYALSGDVAPLLQNTLKTLGMFTVKGDTTNRYNLDGRPVFDLLNSLFFYVGLIMLLWQLIRWPRSAGPAVVLLSTTFFMLLPGFITDDSPHFLRTIGALPVVYIMWAMGLLTALQTLNRQLSSTGSLSKKLTPQTGGLSPLALRLLLLLIILTTLHTTYDYFVRWPTNTEARLIYGADIAEVARYLKTADSDDLVAISAEYYRDLDRFRLRLHFAGNAPFAIWFDGRQSLAFPPPQSRLSPRYIFPASAAAPEQWALYLQPSPTESGREFTLYRLPATATLPQLQSDLTPVNLTVNDTVTITGYRLLNNPATGGQIQLLIAWQALRTLPPGTDYTFLVQLVDNQGHLWLETDGNGYDPGDWQPGIQGLQLLTFHLPGDLPPRTYHLTAQVVDRHTGQPLPTADGTATVPLGTVNVRLANKPHAVDVNRLPNADALAALSQQELWLRGYQINPRQLAVGNALLATLHWQVQTQPRQNYALQFWLAGNAGTYHWPVMAPLGGEWPTQKWPADYWLQDKITLPVLPNVPPGTYQLFVTWVTPAGEPLTPQGIDLGTVTVNP